jgi:hypothetical protein
LSAGATLLDWVGAPLGTLDEASILASARRSSGKEDWGDEVFRGALRNLVEATGSAPLTGFGRVMLRQTWIKAVENRLAWQAWVKAHPSVADVKVERPVFVLGFPRTGTTAMQNLMALDPSRRALQFWELTSPVPQSDDKAADEARRIAWVSRQLKVAYAVAPEMGDVHYIAADTYEECWPLFANTFAVMNFDFQSGIPAVGDYFMSRHDMVHAYREYRALLQLLLFQRPAGNLVLKCPEHLWFLDALLEVFPDACVVWTHRDPYDAVASYCSLISMQWRNLYGRFDPKVVGRHIEDRFLLGVERAMEARARCARPGQIYDVPFHRTVEEPEQVIRDVCAHFGLPIGADSDEQVRVWVAHERADKRGRHVYDAARYGVDRDRVHERFAAYIKAYDIRL